MAASTDAVSDRRRNRRGSRRQIALIVCVLALAYQQVPPPTELLWTKAFIPWVIAVSASVLLAELARSAASWTVRRGRALVQLVRKLRRGFQINYGPGPDDPDLDGPGDGDVAPSGS